MEDGGREIRILNFAVSVASKNKNIENEQFRIFEFLNGVERVERFSGAQFLPDRIWDVRVTPPQTNPQDVLCQKHWAQPIVLSLWITRLKRFSFFQRCFQEYVFDLDKD